MARGWHLTYRRKVDRFFNRICLTTHGCWHWNGYTTPNGYGRYKWHEDRKAWLAHRLMYYLVHGNLDKDLEVCHSCDNPRCVNPEHLFLGTHKQNMEDMARKGRGAGPYIRGSLNVNSILTTSNIIEIRRLSNNDVKRAELSKKFGVSVTTIGRIVRKESWKHITGE